MAQSDKSYIGKGIMYADGIDMGNAISAVFNIEEETKEQKNFRTSGGGNRNSLSRISSVNLSITLTDFTASNIAKGVRGSTSAVTAAAVTDESIAAPASLTGDPLVLTANVIDTAETVTVTSDPAGTTYTADTDYTVTSAGILILDSGSISASDDLLITYTKKAVDVVQALVNSGSEYEITFVGLNESQSDSPVVVTAHRVKFTPASEKQLIGDEFGNLVLEGEVLQDDTKNGTTVSQYFVEKAA